VAAEMTGQFIVQSMRNVLAALLMFASIAGTVVAGQLEDAGAAYGRRDYATAFKLFRPLADHGNANAQFYLGVMWEFGWGVPQNYAEAATWYRKAADQGDTGAETNLGIMYREGRGVPQDYPEPVRLFYEAAAEEQLGIMYRDGLGVPQDYVQAHMWFNLAAVRFVAGEHNTAAENRDLVGRKMTRAQIAEAQRLAREWRPK
jgi:TPR repeat protein